MLSEVGVVVKRYLAKTHFGKGVHQFIASPQVHIEMFAKGELVACRFFRTFDQATASVCGTCG